MTDDLRIQKLIAAGDRLSFAAQTSGGTAGRDDSLVAAVANWADARGCTKCGEPVREVLDGDPLCQAHCDEWARAEQSA